MTFHLLKYLIVALIFIYRWKKNSIQNKKGIYSLGLKKGLIKDYRLWDPTIKEKKVVSRDVFDEKHMLKKDQGQMKLLLKKNSTTWPIIEMKFEENLIKYEIPPNWCPY